MILRASLSPPHAAQDRRRAERRTLRLVIAAARADEWCDVIIHDLTANGLRIETAAPLGVGETITLELPGTRPADARIAWQHDTSFGCEFTTPIPQAAVSAALLQAPFEHPDWALAARLEEVDLGIGATTDDVARWHERFVEQSVASGDRLVGFRRGPGGRIVAMIARGS